MRSILTIYNGWPSNVRGIALMFLGTLIVAINLMFIRFLREDLASFELLFLRYLFSLVALAPLIIRSGPAKVFRTHRLGLYVLRGLFAAFSLALWYHALPMVALAEGIALNFLSALFFAAGAVVFLGEASVASRWWAIALGFAGMLVILRPGFDTVSQAALIVIASAAIWGVCMLQLKVLVRTDSALTLVTYLYVFGGAFSFPMAIYDWVWPSWENCLWLGLMALASVSGHLAMTNAYKIGDVTAVVPVEFMRLVWAALVGFMIFTEIPTLWTWLGGSLIFSSTIFLSVTEQKRNRDPDGLAG